MSTVVTRLENELNIMAAAKPPGVTKEGIKITTALCLENVKEESVIIQKLYTHFKKTPGTHKLGVLYVVDSVTRRWLEQAKIHGQTVGSDAKDGTYAAGVHRVRELIPVLMNDITQTAPQEQKEKIKKLLDIWEKGQTFPSSLIDTFREKLNNSATPQAVASSTPPGSPPRGIGLPGVPDRSATAPSTASKGAADILSALAKISQQPTKAPGPAAPAAPAPQTTQSQTYPQTTQPPAPAPTALAQLLMQYSSGAVPNHAYGYQQPHAQQPPQTTGAYPPSVSAPPPLVNMPPMANPYMPQPPAGNIGQFLPSSTVGNNQLSGTAGAGLDDKTQQQVMLIKALVDGGVPPDKIPAVLGQLGGASLQAQPSQPPPGPYPPHPSGGGYSNSHNETRDHYGHPDELRSPTGGRHHGRDRSRSPGRSWSSQGHDRGRDGRRQADYGRPGSPGRGRYDDDRGRSDYRQRSPQRRRTATPPKNNPGIPPPNAVEKFVEYDDRLPPGHIRVLSRTLFVGGVTCSESELTRIFSQYGYVQSCIVNADKRHAFVKMVRRNDAVKAKEGMEEGRNSEYPQLRCRWGVGYGPRDCSDYNTGISVIPIERLTDADRRWMLSAEYGGSGGKPIETGLVVEEPDIEIGAGVSSKAISRRMQTDRGGHHGPKSSRNSNNSSNANSWDRHQGSGDRHDGGRWGGASGNLGRPQSRDQGHNRANSSSNDVLPDVPSFPFGIPTGPNGMPQFPPGFRFPDPSTPGSG